MQRGESCEHAPAEIMARIEGAGLWQGDFKRRGLAAAAWALTVADSFSTGSLAHKGELLMFGRIAILPPANPDASALSAFHCWIEFTELDASVRGRELPIGPDSGSVAPML